MNENEVKGFKVFNPDWKCRGKQYECPGIFTEDVTPECCEHGIHFCERLVDCFRYYGQANENYHVAEVIARGNIDRGEDKCCTNELEIVREIPWSEVVQLANTGKACTGFCNTGNRNTGNYNTGDCNTGNWNNTSGSAGCFNTEEQPIMMFNKPSEWTLRDWLNSDARRYLNQIPKNVVKWVYSSNMTDEEKTAHPEHETTGGYLKILDESESAQIWWDGASDEVRQEIMSLPNFDAEIFYECTGIKVGI